MPKSNADYQRELRERREEFGFKEVRGLYAPADKHAEIRAEIKERYPLPEGAKVNRGKE